MAEQGKSLGGPVRVKGSATIRSPKEIADFYRDRKGIPAKFYEERFGVRRGVRVSPRVKAGDARLLT